MQRAVAGRACLIDSFCVREVELGFSSLLLGKVEANSYIITKVVARASPIVNRTIFPSINDAASSVPAELNNKIRISMNLIQQLKF